MPLETLLMLAVGLVIGLALMWWFNRQSNKNIFEQGRNTAASELATSAERTRSLQHELEQSHQKLIAKEQTLEREQQALSEASAHQARLSAQAERIPGLEQRLDLAENEFKQKSNELVRISSTDAEKTNQLQMQSLRLAQLEGELKEAQEIQQAMAQELRKQSSTLATLEEQTRRLPGLEQQKQTTLETLEQTRIQLSAISKQEGELRASLEAEQKQLTEAQQREVRLQSCVTENDLQIAKITAELRQLSGEKATLEEQASQLPELKLQIQTQAQKINSFHQDTADLQKKNGQLDSMLKATSDQANELRIELQQVRQTLLNAQSNVSRLSNELTEINTRSEADRQQAEEKLTLLNEAREQLSDQFKLLANQIMDEKSKTFAEQNQTSLGALLDPLKEKIREFQTKVEETYDKESKERFTLQKEVHRLAELNQQISADAINLTQALKGSNKTQGTWGEIVLEKVLESSGLRKGHEYDVQATFTGDEGGQLRPDIIINLPEGKHMVVDSKVSLTAYERYSSAENDVIRQESSKQHLASIRQHIKSLSEKNYQTLHGLKSLDFVLMFIPVEPAFMVAVTGDETLFSDAFNRNVLIVSPSTLLATLRTIASIWRQEMQSRNAQEIAQQCAKLYDKFVGFVEDLEDVGKKLASTQKAYDSAHGKLTSGRGNLIRQAEQVRKLGIKPTKSLNTNILEQYEDVGDELDAIVAV